MGNSNSISHVKNPPDHSNTKNPGEPVFVNVYHLLLCDADLPKWINKLARIASALPFVEASLPAHWVRPALLPYSLGGGGSGSDVGGTEDDEEDGHPQCTSRFHNCRRESTNESLAATNGNLRDLDPEGHQSDDSNQLEAMEKAMDFLYAQAHHQHLGNGSAKPTSSTSSSGQHTTTNGQLANGSLKTASSTSSSDKHRLHLVPGTSSFIQRHHSHLANGNVTNGNHKDSESSQL